MNLDKGLENNCIKKLMNARLEILDTNGFYGLLLLRLRSSLSDRHETAWSEDGDSLFFNPNFLADLSDTEVQYVLMHLLLHVVLGHHARGNAYNKELFDKAADIVVNSIILYSNSFDERFICLKKYGGVQPHLAPNYKEGYCYTAEEVYEMLVKGTEEEKRDSCDNGKIPRGNRHNRRQDYEDSNKEDNTDNIDSKEQIKEDVSWDIHEDYDKKAGKYISNYWSKYAGEAIKKCPNMNISNDNGLKPGDMPLGLKRAIVDYHKPRTDWRIILSEFIQKEFSDYSFTPPDRRYIDIPFFLPGYTENDDRVENVLFMVDSSGSMRRKDIEAAYWEIKGAIDQFSGKLKGWLGFFDCMISDPKEFSDEEDFLKIIPWGGGGTSFDVIFSYVREEMKDDPPVCIVILTDGGAEFPEKSAAVGIPVLWVMTNDVIVPPWGKYAVIGDY